MYLSPIIDCFDGMVISWSIGTRPDAGLVNTMLDAAVETVTDGEGGTIVHSDRGAHYRWLGWLSRINDARLVRSMSRKGCSQDNAAFEGFFTGLEDHHNRNSLSARLMATSDGTMRSASRYHWGRLARSSVAKLSAMTSKSVEVFVRIPAGGRPNTPTGAKPYHD